jgi:hypothetical protein
LRTCVGAPGFFTMAAASSRAWSPSIQYDSQTDQFVVCACSTKLHLSLHLSLSLSLSLSRSRSRYISLSRARARSLSLSLALALALADLFAKLGIPEMLLKSTPSNVRAICSLACGLSMSCVTVATDDERGGNAAALRNPAAGRPGARGGDGGVHGFARSYRGMRCGCARAAWWRRHARMVVAGRRR